MSLTKSNTRRVALFTSSSLVAASLAATLSAGAALAPSAAAAQTVTCVATTSPAISGNGTAAVTLPAGTYNPGLTCDYTGTTATATTGGNITVSSSGTSTPEAVNWRVNGVNLEATGTSAISWTSTAGTVTGGAITNGPVIDARSVDGDIILSTGAVTGSAATATHGIRAAASGTGSVTITNTGFVSGTSAVGQSGIEASTNSGDIVINAIGTGSSAAFGRLRGIYANSSSGDIDLNVTRTVSASGGAGVAVAAIETLSGTGSRTTIDLVNDPTNLTQARSVTNTAGDGIRTGGTGDAVINIGSSFRVQGLAAVNSTVAAGAVATVNVFNDGRRDRNLDGQLGWQEFDYANNPSYANALAARADGAGQFVINNNGSMFGGVDLSGLSGGAVINIDGRGFWHTRGLAMEFGTGSDQINIGFGGDVVGQETGAANDPSIARDLLTTGGVVFVGARQVSANPTGFSYPQEPVHVIRFGESLSDDDEDLIDNAGYFIIGGQSVGTQGGGVAQIYNNQEAEVRIEGLETFLNRGIVLLGSNAEELRTQADSSTVVGDRPEGLGLTDFWYDDILSMPGATLKGGRVLDSEGNTMVRPWNGELAVGEFFMDIDLTRTQTNCTRDAATGDLQAADCIVLAGGATDASDNPIYIRLIEQVPGDRGIINTGGIVLVDVTGGTSQQGDVAISPNQPGWDPRFGGFMDKGAFAYMIAYDESDQKHKLISAPSGNAGQLPLMAQVGHSLWRTSTGTWFERQADLRADNREGLGGGVWARASGEVAEREVSHLVNAFGQTFDFDNSYEQTSYAVTAGFDLVDGYSGNHAYVFGLTLGYAHSDLEYDDSPNIGRFDAWTGGAYGSLLAGSLFLDAALNFNNVVMDLDAPAMDLLPADTILSTRFVSAGFQAEGGYRIEAGGGVFLEPLAGVSYVRSRYDDLYIPADDPGRQGVSAEFDDPTSLRASLGGRAGMEQDFGVVRAQFSLLGRYWNEFADPTNVDLVNPGPTATVTNDFSGSFSELVLGAGFFSPGGAVSGFVNIGGKFGDDYQATTASAGIRVNW